MKAPLRLRRQPRAEPATAFLHLPEDVGSLLRICARLGEDPTGRVYRVAGGFLVKLARSSQVPLPGAIRLRCLAENLYLPADADLLPALLADEAADLSRRSGFVFLPGGRVLGFDPRQSLALAALLDTGPMRRRDWRPLPQRRPFADRLREVRLDTPSVPPEALLDAGAGDIGTEAPRPEGSGNLARAVGGASLGIGRGLHWLGNALHLRGLANFGARLINGGLNLAPRLSESLLGRQEAALRELLRYFREGKLEQALRRALPIGGDLGRGSVAATSAELPTHNLRYSLASLLGTGRASVWFGGGDVQQELTREYRKAAEQATRAGDYRRAAFIYGKLLQDFRLAADVLFRGGLFHDAAVLYLEKLSDALAAAKAFASAGEFDRALELYRRKGEHLLAADLLRRSGEEEEALAEYKLAADLLISKRQDYLAAGNLMFEHVGRPDLAREYYASGWTLGLRMNSVPCGRKLAWIYASHGETDRLLKLLAEAETHLAVRGFEAETGAFFNDIAQLAERKQVAAIRDELRDRALLGIAAKLRERARIGDRPGTVVSALLGKAPAWSPSTVRDADYAYRFALEQSQRRPDSRDDRGVTWVRVGSGTVTAVCHAPRSGELFLGFDDGSVFVFHPATGQTVAQPHHRIPVHALACDPDGDFVAALRSRDGATGMLDGYTRRQGEYWLAAHRMISGEGFWLSPQSVSHEGELLLALHDGNRLALLRGTQLLPVSEAAQPFDLSGLSAILLLPVPDTHPPTAAPFAVAFDALIPCTADHAPGYARLGARPGFRARSMLQSATLALAQPHPRLVDVAGITSEGVVFWAALAWTHGNLETRTTASATTPGGYATAAFARDSLLAAVADSRIDWCRLSSGRLTVWRTTRINLPGVVACHAYWRTQELMVVLADGQVVCLSVPQ